MKRQTTQFLGLRTLGFLAFAGWLATASSLATEQHPTRIPIRRALATSSECPPQPSEILVRFALPPARSERFSKELETRFDLTLIGVLAPINVRRYHLADSAATAAVLSSLSKDPFVEFAERNTAYHLQAVPNDPFYHNFLGIETDLQKWAFDGLLDDRNLNAEAAWDLTTGRAEIVIAIIDSGIDLDHPDLAANLWTNSGEIPGNNVDDDGNGFMDDIFGWDFQAGDADPNPDLGDGVDNDAVAGADSNTFHGTFVASCAAAIANNGRGGVGASWHCRLMPLKIYSDDGPALVSDAAGAILYAANNGASISNLSFGGLVSSMTIETAISFAQLQGVLHVASAGNGNDSAPFFPASLDHVLSIGSTDSGSAFGSGSSEIAGRAGFSQFGLAAVDVVAPGVDLVGAGVLSVADELRGFGTAGGPTYFVSSGTSASAAIVAGLVGLIKSRALDLELPIDNDSIESLVLSTADDLADDPTDTPDGGPDWDGKGRVNFFAAIEAIPSHRFACRKGNVNGGVGVVTDVLFVNGQTGDPERRSLRLLSTDPLRITIQQPPSEATPATPYALYLWLGDPESNPPKQLPLDIGFTCFPTPMTLQYTPQPYRIANTFGFPEFLGTENWPVLPTRSAPADLIDVPSIGTTGVFFLQGLIRDRGAPNALGAVTNGILVIVE